MTPLSTIRSGPKFTMQGRSGGELASGQGVPGPGSYGAADDSATSKNAKPARFVFGSSERDTTGTTARAPGPGAYKVLEGNTTTTRPGPSYSCTPRREITEGRTRKDYPGPGSHSLGSDIGKGTPGWKLGTAARPGDFVPYSPGPAAYSSNLTAGMESSPSWGMGTSERKGMASSSAAPGPGSYKMHSQLVEGPRYSVAARREDPAERKSAGPGPSAYTLNSTVGEGPKSTMSSRDMWNRKADVTQAAPGPGAYASSRMDVVKTTGPRFGFGTSVREGMGSKATAPGPGNYSPRDSGGERPLSYGFGTSVRAGMAKPGGAAVPGPGNYAITGTIGGKGGSKVVMTPRRAPIEGESHAPGPGAYRPEQKEDNTPKWSFGTSHRPQLSNADPSVPAPGTYSHGKALGSDAPKITIGSRLEDPKKDTSGGSGPAWTQFG